MKKLFTILLSGSILLGISACEKKMNIQQPTSANSISEITAIVDMMEEDQISPTEGNIISTPAQQERMYQNPVMDTTHEPGASFGDPFVMRYNGRYYLYSTNHEMHCWTSEDLVNWTYVGLCADVEQVYDAWAPEVTYYNGTFYMSTAPFNGQGPYILTSDSPTGPFTYASKNIDLWFDASIFIDDDGKWYMYIPHSGDTLHALKMDSPTTVEAWTNTDLRLNVASGAWTEGPYVIKHKDTYFMTYCGGGVSNPSYQIHYATTDGDLMKFKAAENYPLIINTDLNNYPATGHNSMVTGPNLDSLYIVYHSMLGNQPRVMMLDPLYINGNYMQAMAPTYTAQQAPDMPDIYSRFDSEESLSDWTVLNAEIKDSELNLSEGGIVLSQNGIEGDFTAEFNFLEINDTYYDRTFIPAYGKAGAIFDYTDANNYGAAYLNTEGQKLEVVFVENGKETVYKDILYPSFDDSFDFSVLQMLTIKKSGNTYTFLFNNRTVGEHKSELKGGAIGVSCVSGTAKVGFVGIEGHVWHSSYKEFHKPIEGEFGAILCVENDLNRKEYNGREYLSVKSGETYNYYINAKSSVNYDFGMKYRSTEAFSFDLYFNGDLIYQGTAPASENDRTEVFRGLALTEGYGILTFKITEGTADIFNYKFITSKNVTEVINFDLASPLYAEEPWKVENGEFSTNIISKYLYGDREWSNYSVSATFKSKGDYLNANMLFRVTQESAPLDYGTTECVAYYLGYYVALVNDGINEYVALCKQNYGGTELARYNTKLSLNDPITVTAEVIDENIKVYLDGNLIIEYSDPEPFIKGAVGFSDISSATVKDLRVEPIS